MWSDHTSHLFCPLVCLGLAVFFALEVMSKPVVSCDSGPCWAGQYYNLAMNSCLECPNGTFTDQNGHSCEGCQPCTTADRYSHQVELRQCTRTTDTLIGCQERFYAHREPHQLDCHPCSQCGQGQIVMEICLGDTDTRCAEVEAGAATDSFHGNASGAVFYTNTVAVSLVAGLAILIAVVIVVVFYCRDNNPGDDSRKQDMVEHDNCKDSDEDPLVASN